MIVELPPNDSERVVLGMMIYVDLGQARAGARGYPSFQTVVVHHYRSAGATDALLAVNKKKLHKFLCYRGTEEKNLFDTSHYALKKLIF